MESTAISTHVSLSLLGAFGRRERVTVDLAAPLNRKMRRALAAGAVVKPRS